MTPPAIFFHNTEIILVRKTIHKGWYSFKLNKLELVLGIALKFNKIVADTTQN